MFIPETFIPDEGFYYQPIQNPNEIVILFQGDDNEFDTGTMRSPTIINVVQHLGYQKGVNAKHMGGQKYIKFQTKGSRDQKVLIEFFNAKPESELQNYPTDETFYEEQRERREKFDNIDKFRKKGTRALPIIGSTNIFGLKVMFAPPPRKRNSVHEAFFAAEVQFDIKDQVTERYGQSKIYIGTQDNTREIDGVFNSLHLRITSYYSIEDNITYVVPKLVFSVGIDIGILEIGKEVTSRNLTYDETKNLLNDYKLPVDTLKPHPRWYVSASVPFAELEVRGGTENFVGITSSKITDAVESRLGKWMKSRFKATSFLRDSGIPEIRVGATHLVRGMYWYTRGATFGQTYSLY